MSSAHATTTHDDTPAIYVANLGAYNEGRLVGEWIKLEDGVTADDINERIQSMLSRTGGEEYAVHDYDNMPSSLGEWPDMGTVAAVAQAIHDHGHDLVTAYIECFEEDSLDQLKDRLYGVYKSAEDFAYEYLNEQYDIDKMMGGLAGYFDYEAYARDLFMDDFVSADVSDGIAVFSSN
jgi:antirestriction protein